MTDIFSKEKRSWIMSRIKAKTKFESDFLKKLSSIAYPAGYRYRKHYKKLLGKPDVVFPKQRIVIFLDGDFWHGRDLKQLKKKTIRKFWVAKIGANIKRDRRCNQLLKKQGWTVLRFWEKEIKKNPERAITKILDVLKKKA